MLALGGQFGFQFHRAMQVILDASLAAMGYKNDFFDPGRYGFIDRILDQGAIHDRQHFLRYRFGRRQKTRSQACNRKHRLAYHFCRLSRY